MKTKKNYGVHIELDDIVLHDRIYEGKESMKVIGIRKNSVELEGDLSGGTHNVTQSSWFPIEGVFKLSKVCENKDDKGVCPLHNLHCIFPDCEPYLV